MTEQQYLQLEASSDVRHEFINGDVIAMAGASPEHSVVREGLAAAVLGALRGPGKPCMTFSSDTRVRITETGVYAYPDLTVVCGTPEFDRGQNPPSLLNPLVIFEVLSDSTEAFDRGAKAAHYRRRESLREYVLISIPERKAEVIRRSDDAAWWQTGYFEAPGRLPLASLDIEIPLSEVFAQLDLL